MGTVLWSGNKASKTILLQYTVKLWHSIYPYNTRIARQILVQCTYTIYIVYSAGLLTFSLLSELFPSYQITLSRSNYRILQEQTNWPSSLITKLNSAALLVMWMVSVPLRSTLPGTKLYNRQCCGSKNSNKKRGEKKLVVLHFYVATNFTKLKIILVLKCWRKKFGPIFEEL